MRKILLILIAILPLLALGQKKQLRLDSIRNQRLDSILNLVQTNDGKIFYEKVFESDFSSKEQMINARKWIANKFTDYKSVVKLDDTISRNILFKGISNDSKFSDFRYGYTFDISFKDRKFKINVYDITIAWSYYPTRTLEQEIAIIKDYKKGKVMSYGGVWCIESSLSIVSNLINSLSAAINTKKDDF